MRIAVGLGLLLLAAGCNSRGTIGGKVLYKGKPLPGGGKVLFVHEKKGAFSCAIREDGSYSFTDIPTGQVKIAVSNPPSLAGPADDPMVHLKKPPKANQELLERVKKHLPSDVDEKGMRDMMGLPTDKPPAPAPRVGLPAKYGDPEKSGLIWTVGSGSQTHDIELE